MTKAPKLTPTSFALLGLLERGPKSAYELNTIMQTSLIRVYWPRAESHVYSEPKKLLAHGLVSEQRSKLSGRNRTVYTITGTGRDALANWLAEDSEAALRMPSEFMLKLILANAGRTENALATLARSLQCSEAEMKEAIAGITEILENPGYGEAGMPWNGIAINLLADVLIARYQWSSFALDIAKDVEQKNSPEDRSEQGIAAYRTALEKMQQALLR
jgi:DNA-binding PadR family transcriptional regulator